MTTVIVDYRMGNTGSVKRKLDRIGVDSKISFAPNDIASADKLILPGVGNFKKAMENLDSLNLLEVLNEAVLVKKKPILGICLGMQLMAKCSEEGHANGLGWFDAEVVRFKVSDQVKFKIPHTGWNEIKLVKDSVLNNKVSHGAEFYFVHSYFMKCSEQKDILHETTYEESFTSAIEKENIYGVQYHPEKSHSVGEQLLRNFINL